jgi:hypothetical protein
MIKVIYNASTANNGEQNKENNNNAIKYLEFNKDKILDLAEKNYQNLVGALTNNAINNATHASSNPTLSSPQSSCTFPNPATQNDTHRKEESEIYDNGKGDIAD